MELTRCNFLDIPLLAKLNEQLLEDEKNDYIPTIDVLEKQLKHAMELGTKAYLFKEDGAVVGYALVKTQLSPNYLWHFFICRDKRRKHLGTKAFNQLLLELNTNSIDLDVFVWNHRGQDFWKSLDFKERAMIMRKC